MELLRPKLPEKIHIKASGGYIKSRLWLKIQANLFKAPIKVPYELEAASLGAAMISMFSQGIIKDLELFEPEIKEVILPDEKEAQEYDIIYRRHLEAYRCLEGYFS